MIQWFTQYVMINGMATCGLILILSMWSFSLPHLCSDTFGSLSIAVVGVLNYNVRKTNNLKPEMNQEQQNC